MRDPDYILDIQGAQPGMGGVSSSRWVELSKNEVGQPLRGRPWLAVKFRCCSVYNRIYRNAKGDAYEGRCPKCNKAVRATIGAGGTSCRFFEAD